MLYIMKEQHSINSAQNKMSDLFTQYQINMVMILSSVSSQ